MIKGEGKRLEGLDRGCFEGFKEYMQKRPDYFRDVFGNKTIREAWNEVGAIKKGAKS